MASLTLTRIFSGEAANEILCYRHFIMGNADYQQTEWRVKGYHVNLQTNEKE